MELNGLSLFLDMYGAGKNGPILGILLLHYTEKILHYLSFLQTFLQTQNQTKPKINKKGACEGGGKIAFPIPLPQHLERR